MSQQMIDNLQLTHLKAVFILQLTLTAGSFGKDRETCFPTFGNWIAAEVFGVLKPFSVSLHWPIDEWPKLSRIYRINCTSIEFPSL